MEENLCCNDSNVCVCKFSGSWRFLSLCCSDDVSKDLVEPPDPCKRSRRRSNSFKLIIVSLVTVYRIAFGGEF